MIGGTVLAGGFYNYYTKNTKEVPVTPTDNLLTSPTLAQINPKNHQIQYDKFERRIPLNSLPTFETPELLDLFVKNVFSGWAFGPQRKILARFLSSPNLPETTVFDVPAMKRVTIAPGVNFSNHFEVTQMKPNYVECRIGFAPDPRPIDGTLTFEVAIENSEAVFRLGSVIFDGTKNAPADPGAVWRLHKIYAQTLLESGVRACLKEAVANKPNPLV